MSFFLRYTLMLTGYFVPFICYAQVDSGSRASITGTIIDSARNYLIRDATIAVYSTRDTNLIQYQLSDQLGRFKLEKLLGNQRMKIVISYAGYGSYQQTVEFRDNSYTHDLGYINLHAGTDLENVVVKSIIPVRMNGDTLEFNADAFKMEKDAVAEDLLRRLPGVVLWGDGTITVNGRNVHVVYVDGKRFFGDNTKVATQNIPKDALDKVQVYQQNKNPDNPFDSTTAINLKLKESKKNGYFGKIAGGIGTKKTFDFDLGVNAFTKRMQLGIVGALNNTNKIAQSVDDLLLNSTFKSKSFDYKPDLTLQGMTRSKSTGLTFNYDLKKNADSRQGDQILLKGQSFINDQYRDLEENISTITAVGGDTTLMYETLNKNISSSLINNTYGTYTYQNSNIYFEVRPYYQEIRRYDESFSKQRVASSIDGVISESNTNLNESLTNSKLGLETLFSGDLGKTKALAKQVVINYKIFRANSKNHNDISNLFSSYVSDSKSLSQTRSYSIQMGSLDQELNLSFLDFGRLLRNFKWLSSIQYNLINNLKVKEESQDQLVHDMLSNLKVENIGLSNQNTYSYIEYTPGVSLSKNYIKSISNRYKKSVSINADFKYRILYQSNRSENSLLTFTKKYSNFVPALSFNYANEQYGRSKKEITFAYKTDLAYPELDQLYQLVDSINPYFIRLGNSRLSESVGRSFSLRYQYTGLKRNAVNAGIYLLANGTTNALSDSTVLLNDGSMLQYTVNLNGYKRYLLSANFSKNLDLSNSNKIQLLVRPVLDYSRRPRYLRNGFQSLLNISPIFTLTNNIAVYYTYKERFYLSTIFEQQSNIRYKDRLSSNNLYTNLKRFSVICGVNLLNSVNVNSDLSYSSLAFNQNQKTDFFLLNMSLERRFLSGRNLSLKFSTFDIFRQNKSLITNTSASGITTEQRSVLQNYYMLTISYYPRQFGKRL